MPSLVNLFASPVLAEIEALDPLADHQRIALLSCRVDFAWDTTRALEFALFRTFAVPSISALLHGTGEFRRRPQKRYDDTDIIVSTLIECGYDSERGKAALARMNQLHGRFNIRNEDFLYVLSTFIFEPIRWNARFGWRPMSDKERIALFHFWRAVGERMRISAIPADYAAFERFNCDYESRHFLYTESNRQVGIATRELFKSWFPAWCRPLVEQGIHAFMDDTLRAAFGFPKPPPFLAALTSALLKLRGRALRCWPRRSRPLLRTAMTPKTYPGGYRLEDLGPPRNG